MGYTPMKYSEKISHLLKSRGISLRAFVAGANISMQTAQNLKSGKGEGPNTITKQKVAAFFNLPPEQLFDDGIDISTTTSLSRSLNLDDKSQRENVSILTALLGKLDTLIGVFAPSEKYDNSKRLIARPDFEAARLAAPEWCRDALHTINALEYELERLGIKSVAEMDNRITQLERQVVQISSHGKDSSEKTTTKKSAKRTTWPKSKEVGEAIDK
ncbi:XRE family transcriptional regulator [Opitutaceae bacterium TAV4]|nr:XRE family transcriptional regulator [Opitutaceae bacterium TAV4]RRK00890.1 XRE family transcriptional regulator [Opitutaceae bacterium TAV3]